MHLCGARLSRVIFRLPAPAPLTVCSGGVCRGQVESTLHSISALRMDAPNLTKEEEEEEEDCLFKANTVEEEGLFKDGGGGGGGGGGGEGVTVTFGGHRFNQRILPGRAQRR